jgi:hypothetical protein
MSVTAQPFVHQCFPVRKRTAPAIEANYGHAKVDTVVQFAVTWFWESSEARVLGEDHRADAGDVCCIERFKVPPNVCNVYKKN